MQLQLAAANVLGLVIHNDLSLDDALTRYADKVGDNRPQLHELCYGTCRYFVYFDSIIAQLLKKPIKHKDRVVHYLLIGALYQIDHMRTPDHAAVNQCVKALAKTNQTWAKGMVNGVLRNYLRNKSQMHETMTSLAQTHSFPDFFVDQFKQSWPEHYATILASSNLRPPMTLRVNRRVTTREDYVKTLETEEIDYTLTSDSDIGVTLNKPQAVEKVPGFSDGLVSVQDESAQLVVSAMSLAAGQRVLDGCAAPGGKTCAMLEAEPGLSSMTAVDFEKRIKGIEQNLERLSLDATLISADVTSTDMWWDDNLFDRILLDVPCSGSGVIRRHPDIKHRRKDDDFIKFAARQLRILNAGWTMLKPGGILLYVTCSVLQQENDGVVGEFLGQHDDAKTDPLAAEFGLETEFGRQRLPGVHSGDGFYFCRIIKTL